MGWRRSFATSKGIGTDPGDSEYEAFLEGAIGVGVDRRIVEGYRFLAERYQPGDEIHLFGFSRGAFQARSLAGMIALVGLLRADALEEVDAAWSYYQGHRSRPDFDRLQQLRKLSTPGVRIRCIGVWDTVGNLGIPFVGGRPGGFGVAFHDTQLSPIVDVGLQALAIDEPRGPFNPSLWTRRRGAVPFAGQHIEQVWFPGSHANVGGGFADCSLSDAPLLWMAERAMAMAGIVFDMERLRAMARPDPLGELVCPTSDGIYRVSRLLPFIRVIHQERSAIAPLRRWTLGRWRTGLLAGDLEPVNERVHASAMARFGKAARYRRGSDVRQMVYRPRPLEAVIEGRRGRTGTA